MSDNPTPVPDGSAVHDAVAGDNNAGSKKLLNVGGYAVSGGVLAAVSGGVLLAIFMAQNRDDVTLEFLFWDFTWREWFLVLLSAAIGALVWFGLGVLRRHRRRVARRAVRRGVIPE